MEEGRLPFSRIRAVRGGDPRGLTAEEHRAHFLVAHEEPRYPAEAVARGVEGKVVVGVVIGREGNVLELSAGEGEPLLAQAAMDAIRQWRYRPTKVNGIPVEVKTDIHVSFRLPGEVVVS